MKIKAFALAAALLLLPITALAADNAMHGPMGGMTMQGMSQKMFLKKVAIDGYTVSFHVMPARPGEAMGGNHDFMVKVEGNGQVQTDLVVNSKIVYPDKSAASKMMMKMGDWYMAGYDMDQQGRYQLMVLFKTSDGAKHFGGVYYPAQGTGDGQTGRGL